MDLKQLDKLRAEELYDLFNSAVKHLENLRDVMQRLPDDYAGADPANDINYVDGLDEFRAKRNILKMIVDSRYVNEEDILEVLSWVKKEVKVV